jgi:DUF1680 family protein
MTTALLLFALAAVKSRIVAQPFPLSDVRLLAGPFEVCHEATAKYLLTLEPERLLAGFRVNSGLTAKGEIYGGWETGGLSGHSLGHYLTACSQEYARTRDKRFKAKVDAIVEGLAECQKNRPDGFISAFRFEKGFDRARLDKIWADVKAGNLRSGGFDLNGMWSPWYVHHKVLAGLLDAQVLCRNDKALLVAKKFADWAVDETKDLTDQQWQRMLGTEYGGMNDCLAELYSHTKDKRYLNLSEKFYDNRVLGPLSRGEDDLSGKHSNTQIPKIVGLARLYELTGDEKYRTTAAFFWDRIVNHRTYVIGGNSNGEYLGPADQLSDRISTNTCETCNTYNMLKLTRDLFEWDPKASEMDFYERAYYNHILGSQDPATGMVTYFMPLRTNSVREYSDPEDNFTCCHGTGMENHTKHGDTAYFHDGSKTLWVNLFMPTDLYWREAGLKLRQETAFPASNSVTISILDGRPRTFDMLIRHPGWADGPVRFRVNGAVVAESKEPSSYASIKRVWRKGDKVEFTLPMSLHTEPTPDNPKRVAILYGPVVLAADMGPGGQGGRRNRPALGTVDRTPVLIATGLPIDEWLKPDSEVPLEFKTMRAAQPTDLTFKPFYSLYHSRLGVYFDLFTPSEWDAKEAEYRADEQRLKDLDARTTDSMLIGQMQPERDHNLTEDRNDIREQNGRSTRQPLPGGWFEFDMKIDGTKPVDLLMTYWGNDRSRADFKILVDGQEVAFDKLQGRPLNAYYDVIYPLPEDATKGKSKIRVRVEPAPTHPGPTVAGARTVRR